MARNEDDEDAVDYELSDEDGEDQSANDSGYPTSSDSSSKSESSAVTGESAYRTISAKRENLYPEGIPHLNSDAV